MEIRIKGKQKEIADLVVALQGQQKSEAEQLKVETIYTLDDKEISKSIANGINSGLLSATCDTDEVEQD